MQINSFLAKKHKKYFLFGKHCYFSLNADLNASRNISQNYLDAICHPSRAAVNPPIAPKASVLVEQAQPSLVAG